MIFHSYCVIAPIRRRERVSVASEFMSALRTTTNLNSGRQSNHLVRRPGLSVTLRINLSKS